MCFFRCVMWNKNLGNQLHLWTARRQISLHQHLWNNFVCNHHLRKCLKPGCFPHHLNNAQNPYCSLKKSGVHQLRLIVYPIVYRFLFSSQVVQDFFHQQYDIPLKWLLNRDADFRVYYNWVGFHPPINPKPPGALFSLLTCLPVSCVFLSMDFPHKKQTPGSPWRKQTAMPLYCLAYRDPCSGGW